MGISGLYYIKKYLLKWNKKLSRNCDIIIEYAEKLQKQFDIFYYMQQNKKLNLIEGIIFDPIERKMINLVSKKYYKVSSDGVENIQLKRTKTRKKETENNEEIVQYILDNKDCAIDSREEQLIRVLIN